MKRSNRTDALQKLVQQRVLKPESAQAIIQSCDPFHDYAWSPTGLPDGFAGKSIVRVVKRSQQIVSPFADKTIPFDCHIFTLDEFVAYTQYSQSPDTELTTYYKGATFCGAAGGGNLFPAAPFVIVCTGVGHDTTPANGVNLQADGAVITFVDYNAYSPGQTRILSSAFEVHNVTNELNVSGTATVYRLPQSRDLMQQRFVSTAGASASVQNFPTVVSRCPPAQLSDVMLLADTKQWEAKWGCYLVETFDHDENRPAPQGNLPHLWLKGDFDIGSTGQILNGFGRSVILENTAYYSVPSKPIPKNTSGVYFTGLNGATQLTLTTAVVVETFPTATDPLVTLTRSTPDFDPMFFEIYKAIANTLPPGVMVGENASGDFWDKILEAVSSFAAPIGAMFGPVGGLVGGGVGKLATMGRDKRNGIPNAPAPKPDNSVAKTPNGWKEGVSDRTLAQAKSKLKNVSKPKQPPKGR